jgi:hypothetical protein
MRQSGAHSPVPLSGFLQYPAFPWAVVIGVDERKARIAMKALIQIKQ